MFKFRWAYFLLTLLLLFTEVAIAIFIRDDFIRPYGGDMLVVILVYSFIRSFVNLSIYASALIALLFCFLVETLQYFNFVKILGLEGSGIAGTAIGHSFDWIDILMYTIGILLVLIIEKLVLEG